MNTVPLFKKRINEQSIAEIKEFLDRLGKEYIELLEENYKLKNKPKGAEEEVLFKKCLEKDKEIVTLRGRLEDAIKPNEFIKISNWYNKHLKKNFNTEKGFNPDNHKLTWELTGTGLGIIRLMKCSCGSQLDLSEWY